MLLGRGMTRPVRCCAHEKGEERATSIFQLALDIEKARKAGSRQYAAVERILDVSHGPAHFKGTRELEAKFGMPEEGSQLVVCVTDRSLRSQVWWNEIRSKKPQTFTRDSPFTDPTDSGNNCDFCRWDVLTATDTFGRVENESCVTASNLFKYAFPCHGLVIFKHHNPLEFTASQVHDMLCASSKWFQEAHATNPGAPWPLLIWNCLPRAGASQYHGHAQVLLTQQPTPSAQLLAEAADSFGGGRNYFEALQAAHQSVGLLRLLQIGPARATCFASLAPTKDKELTVLGDDLSCPAFAALLHGALRTLIDRMGVTHFNVGVMNVGLGTGGGSSEGPVFARLVSRGNNSSKASDYGGLEVFGGASIGHTDPFRVISALDSFMAGEAGYSACLPDIQTPDAAA